MAYLVLARKYRPRFFEDVAGQETVVRTIVGALQEGRIGHAYLFTGPRGTGKTTTARILARALNCERGPTPKPCGTCERCQAIEAGNDVDVIEIDAASNRRLEETRDLLERVAYAPMHSRFKVYIVDEVHMLTKEAFNALLKTLEEPPAHVKFLFATTELHKVLETIRSRCQVVRLNLLREEAIAARLDEIFALEGIEPGAGVSQELARLARGSLRDALSATDQLLSLVGKSPTRADVLRLNGDAGKAAELLDLVEQSRRAQVLEAIAQSEGFEEHLADELLLHVRQAVLAGVLEANSPLLDPDPSARARHHERAVRLGSERLRIWMEELLLARERIRAHPLQARYVLEWTLLELCNPASSIPLLEWEQRLSALELLLRQGQPAGSFAAASPTGNPSGAAPRAPSATMPHASPAPALRAPVLSSSSFGSVPQPQGSTPTSNPTTSKPKTSAPAQVERKPTDPFTSKVVDLFAGNLEDPA